MQMDAFMWMKRVSVTSIKRTIKKKIVKGEKVSRENADGRFETLLKR
jgi:(2Fe-2S) ferredoxin